MSQPVEDLLRLLRNGCSLRLKASSYSDQQLHQMAQNLKEKGVLHIVMDRKFKIEDLVQIASAAKGTVLFDHV